jgi:hypothetical protein
MLMNETALRNASAMLLAWVGLSSTTRQSQADTLIVSWDGTGNYVQIQPALDAALDGDTIVVMPSIGAPGGAYFENLSFPAKAIILRSSDPDDPATVATTVIDGGAVGRVITFAATTPATATLAGFTIRNGLATFAAGINLSSASPTIERCSITDNHASNPGNQVVGGTIFGSNSSATLRDCLIVDNAIDASLNGFGSVAFFEGAPIVERCTIGGNLTQASSNAYAGGLYLFNTGATITACRISGNASVGGGTAQGGGISISGDTAPHVRSCTIVDNSVTAPNSYGGGLRCVSQTKATFTHCAVSRNTARVGGGLWTHGTGTSIDLQNCVVWDNPTSAGPPVALEVQATASVSYSNIQGGAGAVLLSGGASLHWQAGNISSDPLFAAPAGADGDFLTWADNDHHLLPGSPCISRGDPAFIADPDEADIDGDPRIVGCATDMGSDESPYGLTGDLDNNGDFNAADHSRFEPCLVGPGETTAADCLCADMDLDGTVDLLDFALLQAAIDAN